VSTVIVNGVATHVQEIGSGPPVVMAHGLLIGSLASWYFTAGPELAREHRVRMYDLRGHGLSARPASGYDTTTLAGDLAALTDDLPQFDLVGHSWGGLVALRFAMAHPDRVRRLAIVEAPMPPSPAGDDLMGGDVSPENLLAALPDSLRTAVASGKRQAARFVATVVALVRDTSLIADVRGEPTPDATSLRVPTLLAYGDRSSCLPGGRELAAQIPGAQLHVLAGGHYLHLDARAELARLLGDFLRG
jgi:pimeloyl-ACP methyl ester carboxylesterase